MRTPSLEVRHGGERGARMRAIAGSATPSGARDAGIDPHGAEPAGDDRPRTLPGG